MRVLLVSALLCTQSPLLNATALETIDKHVSVEKNNVSQVYDEELASDEELREWKEWEDYAETEELERRMEEDKEELAHEISPNLEDLSHTHFWQVVDSFQHTFVYFCNPLLVEHRKCDKEIGTLKAMAAERVLSVGVATVNCYKWTQLCADLDIRNFPYFLLFAETTATGQKHSNKKVPIHYRLRPRRAAAMMQWIVHKIGIASQTGAGNEGSVEHNEVNGQNEFEVVVGSHWKTHELVEARLRSEHSERFSFRVVSANSNDSANGNDKHHIAVHRKGEEWVKVNASELLQTHKLTTVQLIDSVLHYASTAHRCTDLDASNHGALVGGTQLPFASTLPFIWLWLNPADIDVNAAVIQNVTAFMARLRTDNVHFGGCFKSDGIKLSAHLRRTLNEAPPFPKAFFIWRKRFYHFRSNAFYHWFDSKGVLGKSEEHFAVETLSGFFDELLNESLVSGLRSLSVRNSGHPFAWKRNSRQWPLFDGVTTLNTEFHDEVVRDATRNGKAVLVEYYARSDRRSKFFAKTFRQIAAAFGSEQLLVCKLNLVHNSPPFWLHSSGWPLPILAIYAADDNYEDAHWHPNFYRGILDNHSISDWIKAFI